MNPYAVTCVGKDLSPDVTSSDHWKFAFIFLLPVGANQVLLTLGSMQAYLALIGLSLVFVCGIFRKDAARGMNYAGLSLNIWVLLFVSIFCLRYHGIFPLTRFGLEPVNITRFFYAIGHSFGLWLLMHPLKLHGIIKD